MIVVSEQESAALVDEELAFEAARDAFAASVAAVPFPSLVVHGSDPANTFSVKPAASTVAAGVKIGSYWPGNQELGLPRHSSLILLFDQRVGRIAAVIEAGAANAYRTAAADALAVDLLARPSASTLTVVGTGHQARYEVRAVVRRRPISDVLVVGRRPEAAEALVTALASDGIVARAEDAETAVRAADIVVTATTARAPLFPSAWVRPGTHVSAMGADARGKQELDPALLEQARLFCDLVEQSGRIGELQHTTRVPIQLGTVLGGGPGRTDDDQITVFDSSGIGLQDIALGLAILRRRGTPL